MAAPGWYPDPLDPAGGLRWWDGSIWTDQVRPAASSPGAPPTGEPATGQAATGEPAGGEPATAPVPGWSLPSTGATPGGPPRGASGFVPPAPPGMFGPPGGPGQPGPPGTGQPGGPPTGRSSRRLLLIVGGAAVVVLLVAVGLFLATRNGDDGREAGPATTAGEQDADQDDSDDSTTSTESAEPTTTDDESEPAPGGDRISIGVISYQALAGDWEAFGSTVPFLPGATGQVQITQENAPTPGGTFVASVVIGFLAPEIPYTGPDDLEPATLALTQSIIATSGSYPEGAVAEITLAEPRQVDSHPAFVVRVELTYAVEGLNATGETVQIAVIDTGTLPAAFWGSVPNDVPQLVPDMDAAFNSLTVDG